MGAVQVDLREVFAGTILLLLVGCHAARRLCVAVTKKDRFRMFACACVLSHYGLPRRPPSPVPPQRGRVKSPPSSPLVQCRPPPLPSCSAAWASPRRPPFGRWTPTPWPQGRPLRGVEPPSLDAQNMSMSTRPFVACQCWQQAGAVAPGLATPQPPLHHTCSVSAATVRPQARSCCYCRVAPASLQQLQQQWWSNRASIAAEQQQRRVRVAQSPRSSPPTPAHSMTPRGACHSRWATSRHRCDRSQARRWALRSRWEHQRRKQYWEKQSGCGQLHARNAALKPVGGLCDVASEAAQGPST